ncbi:hypothetical protein PLANPX_5483 [Lacipirellula parvula]|uniref:Uncharacterized protein n=1 Tax=Lacipirellula parvula TaxID=2650471 RepID=A0A5K7XKY6_9BACT|nr:hypothetical protein PLANPX_5483 [Lacipirellula parvula]
MRDIPIESAKKLRALSSELLAVQLRVASYELREGCAGIPSAARS